MRHLPRIDCDHLLAPPAQAYCLQFDQPPSQQPFTASAALLSVAHQVNFQRNIAAAQCGHQCFLCLSDPYANYFLAEFMG